MSWRPHVAAAAGPSAASARQARELERDKARHGGRGDGEHPAMRRIPSSIVRRGAKGPDSGEFAPRLPGFAWAARPPVRYGAAFAAACSSPRPPEPPRPPPRRDELCASSRARVWSPERAPRFSPGVASLRPRRRTSSCARLTRAARPPTRSNASVGRRTVVRTSDGTPGVDGTAEVSGGSAYAKESVAVRALEVVVPAFSARSRQRMSVWPAPGAERDRSRRAGYLLYLSLPSPASHSPTLRLRDPR